MNQEKCIVFVAEMRNPNTNASSTQIMTSNLLQGFRELCEYLIFLPVIADKKDEADICAYYRDLCDDIFVLKQKTTFERTLILRQLSMYKEAVIPSKYSLPDKLLRSLKPDAVLVSQSPTIDTILVCRQIRKNCPEIRYIQYWGDPIALSGIIREKYGIKRALLRKIEKRVHNYADEIVFGTQALYREQLKLFPEIAKKTRYCDVAYNPKAALKTDDNSFVCGYFGNYYSAIRDIIPLYNAFKEMHGYKLVICGSSDLNLESTDEIMIMQRIPQSQVEIEEAKTNIEICLLNKACAQIPGKLFYHTNTNKPIIVILDGPRSESIKKELEKSKRFIFCENNEESIRTTITSVICNPTELSIKAREYYSPSIICNQIIGKQDY